jgi:hypothetical protein
VAGRALAFSDPQIVKMAKEDYVPVACDDWYQRRRQDAEGEFFRKVSDQGPRGHMGSNTRQGIYLLTADGELLAYKNAGQNAQVMRDVLKDALAKWNKLPEARRKPGAVTVPDAGKLDGGYTRKPPAGGLVVNVYARALEKSQVEGTVSDAVCKIGDGDEASRDHLWLTADEWRSLVPTDARPGDRFPVAPAITRRIARFHLIDNTRGEPPMWRREDVRSAELNATVQEADASHVLVRLDGKALLATEPDVAAAQRGYDAALLGYVRYDKAADRVDRVDVVALGDHWGQGTFTPGARPGRQPLGVAFELARGDKPGDTVPPQAAREQREYFAAGR